MKQDNKKIIPVFREEEKERDFWSKADASEYFDFSKGQRAIFTNLRPSRESISLRLPTPLLSKIKLIASKRDVPYQSLIKTYLAESVSKDFKFF